MKRSWLYLLSLALIVVFSASAFAVDVTFSGSYYAAGLYQDKTSFKKGTGTDDGNPSTAFYYQRLRMKTEFTVSKGLKLITRMDAMERAWGLQEQLRMPFKPGSQHVQGRKTRISVWTGPF